MPKEKQPPSGPEFIPFADDATVRSVGDLSFENGTTRIAIHGSVDVTRDRNGRERAQSLRDLFAAVVAALDQADLPDRVAEDTPPRTSVRNPFA